jgi:hypothetical protein
MRRYFSWLILIALLLTASGMAAAKGNDQAKYKVVEVKHPTKADGIDLSAEFLNYLYDDLRKELANKGIFGTVVEEGGAISDADAATAVVLECKITELQRGFASSPSVIVEVTLSNRGDRKVIQQFTIKKISIQSSASKSPDNVRGKWTAYNLANEIKRNMK